MVFAIQIKKEMIMNKFLKNIIGVFIFAPAVYLAIIWNRLPEQIVTHFTLRGHPDKYGSKTGLIAGVAVITAVSAAVYLFLPLVYKIDPKKTAAANKTRLQRLA